MQDTKVNLMIGICPKYTKLEWDMHVSRKSMDEVISGYHAEEMDVNKILDSHHRQKDNIERILSEYGSDAVVIDILSVIENRKDENVRKDKNDMKDKPKIDVLVSIGGDNFFQLCTHHYPDSIILGVNSDPQWSHGGLLYFDSGYLIRNIGNIISGNYSTEYWTRVSTTINGKRISDGTCTVSLGTNHSDMITRYLLRKGIESEEQKSSGILVVSGAGSGDGAWYRNAGLYLSSNGKENTGEFGVSERRIMTLTREPFFPGEYSMTNVAASGDESIELVYWSNEPAMISVDSIDRYDVHNGDRIEFSVSDKSLEVIRDF